LGVDVDVIEELTDVISRAAATIVLARKRSLDTRVKDDRSPVTAADEASEAVLIEGVSRALPGVSIVSEEAHGSAAPPQLGSSFVLIDPLDGTRELIEGRDEFCVNIALVENGRPRIGIIAAPALGLVWRTSPSGAERLRLAPGAPASAASERSPISAARWAGDRTIVAISRSHLDPATQAFLSKLPRLEKAASGSAIKLCHIAEGSAHVYPRLGPVREWDIAAGDAIVAAAGGLVTTPSGETLAYGRAEAKFLVPGFIAWGDPSMRGRLAGAAG
jgi:3'(2'), 5'-bisphosphate nucleotidase